MENVPCFRAGTCLKCGGSVRAQPPTMADQDHNLVVSADVEYMVRRGMTRGYQIFSLLTPPLYAAFVLARRGRNQLFVNRFLRATWLGGVAGAQKPPQFSILLIFNLQGLLEGGQSNGFVLRAHLQKVYAIAECITHIMYCSTLFCSRKKNAYSFQPTKDCIDTSG